MLVTEIIAQKRDGHRLSPEAITQFMKDYVNDGIPDYQASALLMAIFLRGMEDDELALWTNAMVHSGEIIDWTFLDGPKVDKHSSGGIGDKVSIPLAPLVAAAGVYVPMMAGRGLGHTGGTLDKLEAIDGYRVDLELDAFKKVVATVGCSIIGQTAELAPADRKIYALRDVTGTVESVPLIASSIMSKKIAEGIDALILDIKTGSGAFFAELDVARNAADRMIAIGNAAGKKVTALITDMGQPLGQAIGNANEIRESIEILRNEGPEDLRNITLELGAEMLVAAGTAPDIHSARSTLEDHLASGKALDTFRKMVEAQGGDLRQIDDPKRLPQAPHTTTLTAPNAGYVADIQAKAFGFAALELGAGRPRKNATIDPAVGLEMLVKRGDFVEKGQPWCEIHWREEASKDAAQRRLNAALRFQDAPPEAIPLIIDRRGDT